MVCIFPHIQKLHCIYAVPIHSSIHSKTLLHIYAVLHIRRATHAHAWMSAKLRALTEEILCACAAMRVGWLSARARASAADWNTVMWSCLRARARSWLKYWAVEVSLATIHSRYDAEACQIHCISAYSDMITWSVALHIRHLTVRNTTVQFIDLLASYV